MTLPDNLASADSKQIITCYGYLMDDSRWLAGLPQFTPCDHKSMDISLAEIEKGIPHEIVRQ